ncbi:hypothetical protein H0H87_010810 [Tephrocybe sp. NHM501043]|nr:hypothetical protein H0H87_010810 [Tephrocybe sp. NHM501043]
MGFNHHYATGMVYPRPSDTYEPWPAPSTTLNVPPSPMTTPATNQHKRKNNGTDSSQTQKPPKRARRTQTTAAVTDENLPPIQAASHCSVGPAKPPASSAVLAASSMPCTGPGASDPPLGPLPPLHSFGADFDNHNSEGLKSAASDVFYFLRALEVDEEPKVCPDPEKEPRLTKNSGKKVKYVGCKLCKCVLCV